MKALKEYHKMCLDSEEEYLEPCVSTIVSILENVVFEGRSGTKD